MKRYILPSLMMLSLAIPSLAAAGEQTIKLSVPTMSCASCPYMVKKAFSTVKGVKEVSATMKDRSATVTYDDDVTTIEEIQKATASIGYKSSLFDGDKGS